MTLYAVPKPSRRPRLESQASGRTQRTTALKRRSIQKHRTSYGGSDWQAAKSRIRARDQGTCQWCGKSAGQEPPHHITKVAAGGTNDDSNLILLCRLHHADADEYRISRRALRQRLAAAYGYVYPDLEGE